MGHTTPSNLKISIRLYVLIKVAISVRFPGLAGVSVMHRGVVHPDGDDLLQ